MQVTTMFRAMEKKQGLALRDLVTEYRFFFSSRSLILGTTSAAFATRSKWQKGRRKYLYLLRLLGAGSAPDTFQSSLVAALIYNPLQGCRKRTLW